MTEITILSEIQLQQCIGLDSEAIEAVEGAFTALASGKVIMPPILRLDIEEHHGEIDVKTAYIPGLDSFAVKMSPGFFNNPKIGLPSTNGLMTLFSAHTGLVEAMLLDNGYLTDVRTAAAGAIASKYLANEQIDTVGVIGTGSQARFQVEALKLVREFSTVLVWGRDADKAAACAKDIADSLGVDAGPCAEVGDVVAASQIVITSTPSTEPLIHSQMLHPGLHITAMGSDAEHKNELDTRIIADCDTFVCDTRAQSAKLGELHHAIDAGVVAADVAVAELGQIITGDATGRQSTDDVTVCDLTGTGAQDTAIARLAFQKAQVAALGTRFET
jgi:ectoine utilization protein EutC